MTEIYSRRAINGGIGSLLLGVAAAPLGGCNIFPDADMPQTLYRPTPDFAPVEGLAKADWQLVVSLPVASGDLDTDRIALSRQKNAIEYFADGLWADSAPTLIRAAMVEAFERTSAIRAVGPDVVGLRPDAILQSELRDFQAEYRGANNPEAHIRLSARLMRMPERRVIKTILAEERASAPGTSLPAIVSGFSVALGHAIDKIVAETLRTPLS